LAGDTVLAEYELNADGSVDPASARVVLTLDQPASNHNGGQLEFGPDGYLYIGLGDGGGAGDPGGNGQNTATLLGTILRIDPFTPALPAQYSSPADNPFVDTAGADEIWLYGLRNPWKFAFDDETGNLWIADVGQSAREEITRVGPGEARLNLGWNLREGTAAYTGAEPADHLPPVHDYAHPGAQRSITGGYVYRGADIPALDGAYLYADLYEARLHAWRDDAGIEAVDLDVPTPPLPTTFGQDLNGEIYVLGYGGEVVRLVRELS
jgi:glucose/arabinose dehydrogenase